MTDVLVLNYHAVSPSWDSPLAVDPAALTLQMETVLARGFHGSTARGLHESALAGRVLVVTFDDGYRSVLDHAMPVMDPLGIPGTVFVVTNFVGGSEPMAWPGISHWLGTAHEGELTPLGWSELEQLVASGWEIGSHTCSHPHLTRISTAQLEEELGASRAVLEARLGRPCRSLAYPYGDHDQRVARAAAQAGYEIAFTVPSKLVVQDRLRWPRVGVYRYESKLSFRAKISPSVRALRRTGLWGAAAPALRGVHGTAAARRSAR